MEQDIYVLVMRTMKERMMNKSRPTISINFVSISCYCCGKPIKYKKSLEQIGTDAYVHKGCWNKYIHLPTTRPADLV